MCDYESFIKHSFQKIAMACQSEISKTSFPRNKHISKVTSLQCHLFLFWTLAFSLSPRQFNVFSHTCETDSYLLSQPWRDNLSCEESFLKSVVERLSILKMAAAACTYSEETESFVTCSICLCEFDGETRKPKFLPCAHTLCLECLKVTLVCIDLVFIY